MKTTIYIDGYNLYYGVLKNTPYKWLDVVKLFSDITHQQNPNSEIIAVKFFTAPIKTNLATHGEASQKSQMDYHRALERKHSCFELIEGYFSLSEGRYPKYQKPIDRNETIRAYKLEEKQTDVNIALSLYKDAIKNNTEQLVLVSNDTDLIPAFESIREDCPSIKLGAIMPILRIGEERPKRPLNRSISKLSNWTRPYIKKEELENSQLPKMIPTKKKPIFKPQYW